MKWLILISALCVATGVGLAAYAMTMPYYTSEAAYDRIQNETWNKIDASKDRVPDLNPLYKEFYSRKNAIETPHKKLSDLGRGLCAAGLGGLMAIGVGYSYQRWAWMRTFKTLRRIWILLWVIQVPLAIWYYLLRAIRGDYPGWADSIMIPIVSSTISYIIGATLSLILLFRLVKQRRFPDKISFDQPKTKIEWVRLVIFVLWFVILGTFVVNGIADGNEGDAFTCMVASGILLICLSAKSLGDTSEISE